MHFKCIQRSIACQFSTVFARAFHISNGIFKLANISTLCLLMVPFTCCLSHPTAPITIKSYAYMEFTYTSEVELSARKKHFKSEVPKLRKCLKRDGWWWYESNQNRSHFEFNLKDDNGPSLFHSSSSSIWVHNDTSTMIQQSTYRVELSSVSTRGTVQELWKKSGAAWQPWVLLWSNNRPTFRVELSSVSTRGRVQEQ